MKNQDLAAIHRDVLYKAVEKDVKRARGQCIFQWRNVVGLANMASLGDEIAPLIGAPGVRAYLKRFMKNGRKI